MGSNLPLGLNKIPYSNLNVVNEYGHAISNFL